MTVEEFVSSRIGQPWSVRENCWRFAAQIQRDFFGRRLPLVKLPKGDAARHDAIHRNPARLAWREEPAPSHGAVVLMSAIERPRIDCHAGVCLMTPGPIIVHVDDPHGVAADDLMTLRSRGWFPTFWMPV